MKKTMYNWVRLLIFCMGISLVGSCTSKLDKTLQQACEDGVITDTEKLALDVLFEKEGITTSEGKWEQVTALCTNYGYEIPAVNPWSAPAPVDQRSILVNVYLDNTSSMAGYVRADDIRSFVNVFSGIDAFYMDQPVCIRAYLTQHNAENKKTEILQQDWEKLKSDLTHKQTKFTDSYQLNDFFQVITQKMLADTAHRVINYLITDGIPSGTNAEVNGSRFNINSASILQTRITKAVNACEIGKYAVSIYQFTAHFKGDYFKYNNQKAILVNETRPFYVIAFGEKELVEQMAQRADEYQIHFFEPQHAVHYGFTTPPLIPGLNVDFEYEDAIRTFKIGLDKEDKKKIAISFPISQLPSYAREKTYLDTNLSITIDGKKIDFTVNKGEIIATCELDRYALYEMRFELKEELPAWVKRCTSKDDSSIKDELLKTFNLNVLTEGLKLGILKNTTKILMDEKFIIKYDYQE